MLYKNNNIKSSFMSFLNIQTRGKNEKKKTYPNVKITVKLLILLSA